MSRYDAIQANDCIISPIGAFQEASVCCECLQPLEQCGHCHWVSRDMLPESEGREWDRNHAPPIVQLLRKRWLQADADFSGAQPPALWG